MAGRPPLFLSIMSSHSFSPFGVVSMKRSIWLPTVWYGDVGREFRFSFFSFSLLYSLPPRCVDDPFHLPHFSPRLGLPHRRSLPAVLPGCSCPHESKNCPPFSLTCGWPPTSFSPLTQSFHCVRSQRDVPMFPRGSLIDFGTQRHLPGIFPRLPLIPLFLSLFFL